MYILMHTLNDVQMNETIGNYIANPTSHTVHITIHTSSITSKWYIDVFVLWPLVAQFNGQVGWVSLHLSLRFLLPCWWPLPFWTCFDTVPSTCMEGGSSHALQEGLGQLRGAAQLTTSQLSSAPPQSLVHHCMHHCTHCAGGQWQCHHKGQEDWQDSHCHCGMTCICRHETKSPYDYTMLCMLMYICAVDLGMCKEYDLWTHLYSS